MNIPLLDLKREFAGIRDEVFAAWNDVLSTMKLLGGENLKAFESEMAAYLGVQHVIGVASGSDALTIGLIACGVGKDDEVIIQANAFAADVEAIRLAGATPVLVDIFEGDFGPNIEQLANSITRRTKAVLIVHLYGLPANLHVIMRALMDLGVVLIEDASHAHGAEYNGRKVGTFGKVGCFSCGPIKNLGCYGDGGFITTNDDDVAQRIRILQAHGQAKKNEHQIHGFNSRLDELQAVVLRAKLKHLDRRNARRAAHARRYDEAFQPLGIRVIPTFAERTCSYHQYVIRTPNRDGLAEFLKRRGIGTGIHYPYPLHKQPAWQAAYFPTYFLPVAEKTASEILSLPVFPDLTDAEVDYVIESVAAYFEKVKT